MTWLVASLRRLRDERIPIVGLTVLLLVTAFVAGLAPRAHDRAADEALQAEVAAAPAVARNLQLSEIRGYGAGRADPFATVEEVGAGLASRVPGALRAVLGEPISTVDTPRLTLGIPTADLTSLAFRVQPAADAHIRYVAGRPPGATTRIEPGDPAAEVPDRPFFEMALSVDAARVLGVGVGDAIPLSPDPSDQLVGRGGPPLPLGADVVGLFEPLDADDPFWADDNVLLEPFVRQLGFEIRYYDATGLLAPAAYGALLGAAAGVLPFRTSWRFQLDVTHLTAAGAPRLIEDLRRLETIFPPATGGAFGGTTERIGLQRLLEDQGARWASADATLAVVASGPIAVAIAALGLVTALTVRRRGSALALSRGRGASGTQVVLATLVEGILLSVPAAGVAFLASSLLLPRATDDASRIAVGLVILIALVLLVVAVLPAVAEPPRRPGREAVRGRRLSPRRLLGEALVVLLATGGAWLLRDRGIRGGSSSAALTGADPLLAAAPALVGLAAGIVATRLFPLPVALFARLAAAGRSLVPLLALRRTAQGASSGPVLIVLLATAMAGAFGSAVFVHLNRAAEAVGWQDVGAAFRIDAFAGRLPEGFDPATLPGVDIAASAIQTKATIGSRGQTVTVLALDAAAYRRVVAGTPLDGIIPDELVGAGTAPFPAIVSAGLIGPGAAIGPNGTFDFRIGGFHPTFRVVDARASFPTLPLGEAFIVVSRDQLLTVVDETVLRPSEAFLRAPDGSAATIRVAWAAASRGATMASRAETTARLGAAPVVGVVSGSVALAVGITALYAALAVAAAVALAGAARADEVAHLRVLGLSRRESLGLIALEHGPTIVFAFAAGVALGIGLFAYLRPGLGLGAIIGSSLEVPLAVDPLQLGIVFLVIIAVVVVGLALGALLQGRAAAAAALRRGME
jgi:putative ABC transport system permease protein